MVRQLDLKGEKDIDMVAEIAYGIAERIRDYDPRTLFEELVELCRWHPVKAAQVMMALAAWFNTDEPIQNLWARVHAITESRFAA